MWKTTIFVIVMLTAVLVGRSFLIQDESGDDLAVAWNNDNNPVSSNDSAMNLPNKTALNADPEDKDRQFIEAIVEELTSTQNVTRLNTVPNDNDYKMLKTLPDQDDYHQPVEGTTFALWETDSTINPFPDDEIDNIEPVRTDPNFLADLQVGQALDFFIPQLGQSFQGVIDTTSKQMGGVKVWKGSIQDDDEKSNVLITQGKSMTHVVLTTTKGVYAVQIDNKSGEGAVIDEREYTGKTVDIDDGIPFDQHSETEPPFSG